MYVSVVVAGTVSLENGKRFTLDGWIDGWINRVEWYQYIATIDMGKGAQKTDGLID